MDQLRERFTELFNQPSKVEEELVDSVGQSEIFEDLANSPTLPELQIVIAEFQNGIAPCDDGLQAEKFI